MCGAQRCVGAFAQRCVDYILIKEIARKREDHFACFACFSSKASACCFEARGRAAAVYTVQSSQSASAIPPPPAASAGVGQSATSIQGNLGIQGKRETGEKTRSR